MALRPFALVCVVGAVGVVASWTAGAEEPKTYTLGTRETWKVGDVVAIHGVERRSEQRIVKLADGTRMPQSGSSASVSEFDAVAKVLEVDAEGRQTRTLLYFSAWSRTAEGRDPDTSLAGTHVEVKTTGGSRTATIGGGNATPSVEAAAWLDARFGSKAKDPDQALALIDPGKAVAIGESWSPDVAKLAAASGSSRIQFLPEGSEGKVTLATVDGGVAHLRFTARLRAAPLSTSQVGELPWTSGGALDLDNSIRRPVDPGAHGSSASTKATFAGVAGNEMVTVEIDVKNEDTIEIKPGGEMPEPKAQPATVPPKDVEPTK